MSLLDVIGPVMVGPSSSHTAGACRIALLARHTLSCLPEEALIELHGSFAKTGKGHGTYAALVAGLLGFYPDDSRIVEAFNLAKEQGLEPEFLAKDLGDVHPNSVRLSLQSQDQKVTVTGSSLGGGLVKIIAINGFEADFTGAYHTLLVEHEDKPGVIARVARVLADDDVNIATIHSARQKRGGKALMSIEMDKRPAAYVLNYLAAVSYISWLRILPEVMSGVKDDA